MSRWQWFAICLLVVAFFIALAPARLITQRLSQQPINSAQIRLLQPSGTVWNGSADLIINSQPAGRVSWRFMPAALIKLAAGLELRIAAADYNAKGRLLKPLGGSIEALDLSAVANASALQRWLAPYDIYPSGTLTIEHLDLTELELSESGWPSALHSHGQAEFSGGELSYRLAGKTTHVVLPPLAANIATEEQLPKLQVMEIGKDLPLIFGRLTQRGSVAIGITQGFTQLVGQPWPGSEPDHKVVLEVEELLI